MIVKIRNFIRWIVIIVRHFIYRTLFKMDINKSARLSFGAKLDKTYPIGLHIGAESYVASGAIIFTHDLSTGKSTIKLIYKGVSPLSTAFHMENMGKIRQWKPCLCGKVENK